MPGILIHEAMGEMVLREQCKKGLDIIKDEDTIQFLSGNQIPDLSLESKDKTHARFWGHSRCFKDSDIDKLRSQLIDIHNPVKLGVYCHLYSDKWFIKWQLADVFTEYGEKEIVDIRNGRIWTADEFFSHKGLYGAYTNLNNKFIRDGMVNKILINKIPDELPLSGIEMYDKRRDRSWREELNSYLNQYEEHKNSGETVITDKVFSYDDIIATMRLIAEKFVKELAYEARHGKRERA